MNTGHSSLLANTGLSEIELDRMGIVSISRLSYDPVAFSITHPLSRFKAGMIHTYLATWYPYEDRPWYMDDDVKRNMDLLEPGNRRRG